MSVENGKVCCNCRHNIRIARKYCRCYCEIDKEYMTYAKVMTGWCRHWATDAEKWKEVEE